MPKKKDKIRYERGEFGSLLPLEEVERRFDAYLARTKPEERFPEAYKRAVKHIEMLENERLAYPGPTPDPHQTQP